MKWTLFSLVLALTLPEAVWANAGPPSRGGQIAGEPHGLKDVSIARERLRIDLRPLERGDKVMVDVQYQLRNRGPVRTLDLLFAGGAVGVSEFHVRLDGVGVMSRQALNEKLPATWDPPGSTPGLDGRGDLHYLRHGRRTVPPMAFQITVPPGEHRLEVHYTAEAAEHRSGKGAKYWQFAYILSPAKEWAGFGGLDVTIYLPPGWLVATLPNMERTDDVLLGAFTQLPGDAIGITTRAPTSIGSVALGYAGLGAFITALIAGPVLGGWWSWRRGRTAARLPTECSWFRSSSVPSAFFTAFLLTNALFFSGILAIFGDGLGVPASQSDFSGYGQAWALFGLVALTILFFPVSGLVSLIAFLTGKARAS